MKLLSHQIDKHYQNKTIEIKAYCIVKIKIGNNNIKGLNQD